VEVEVVVDQPTPLSAPSLIHGTPLHHLNLTLPLFASRLAEVDDAITVDARTPRRKLMLQPLHATPVLALVIEDLAAAVSQPLLASATLVSPSPAKP
jgi:hypothetical protein